MHAIDPTTAPPGTSADISPRPVLLVTLGVPFDSDAPGVAIQAAVESTYPLVIATIRAAAPSRARRAFPESVADPKHAECLRAVAQLAHPLGIATTILWVAGPRPLPALASAIRERCPGLIVFGPDRRCISRRRYAKAASVVCEARCLVWLAPPFADDTRVPDVEAHTHGR